MDVDLDNNIYYMFFLFDENLLFMFECLVFLEYCKENEVKILFYFFKEIVCEEIKYVEVFVKKIIEIRIFFDNGIYEMFKFENQGGNLLKCWLVE